jgi:hypothetical protein
VLRSVTGTVTPPIVVGDGKLRSSLRLQSSKDPHCKMRSYVDDVCNGYVKQPVLHVALKFSDHEVGVVLVGTFAF